MPREMPNNFPERKRRDYSQVFSPQVVFELYNPGEEPHKFSYDGVDYVIPACNQHWEGKDPFTRKPIRWTKPGVLPLWDRVDGRTPAIRIVKFAVGRDGYSSDVSAINGIRLLFGDERDADVEEEAREAYLERRLSVTEERVRQWESYVSTQRATGQSVRPMPRRVREAYNFRASFSGMENTNKHACGICNWGFPEEVQVLAHVVTVHRDRPSDVAEAQARLSELGSSLEAARERLQEVNDAEDELAGIDPILAAKIGVPGKVDERLAGDDQPLPPLEDFNRPEDYTPTPDPKRVEANLQKQEAKLRHDVSAAARTGKAAGPAQVLHKAGK